MNHDKLLTCPYCSKTFDNVHKNWSNRNGHMGQCLKKPKTSNQSFNSEQIYCSSSTTSSISIDGKKKKISVTTTIMILVLVLVLVLIKTIGKVLMITMVKIQMEAIIKMTMLTFIQTFVQSQLRNLNI